MSENAVTFDWKHPLLTRSQVLTRLHEFLNRIDMEGEILVDVASTQSKVAVVMEENTAAEAQGTIRLVRYSKPCRKKMST